MPNNGNQFSWTSGTTSFRCLVSRSPRRSLAIQMPDCQTLAIKAPHRMSRIDIEAFLERCTPWIHRRLVRLQQLERQPVNQSVCPDSLILYRGALHRLEFSLQPQLPKPQVTLQIPTLLLSFPTLADYEFAEDLLRTWLQHQASVFLPQRLHNWTDRLGYRPAKVVLRDQTSRWGSCSSKGTISLNWRLIMAPLRVIDSILVHELCHLKELNHSPRFWQLVNQHIDDYAFSRQWLAEHGPLLHRLCPK